MLPDLPPLDSSSNTILNGLLSELVNPLLGVATAASICYFAIIVIQYFMAYKNGEDMSKLKSKLVWGLTGVIIISSCWIIVSILYGFRYR